ncbi:RagB/SusD family nutrient uptake outer membrane protein [Pedobacter panaciterrae]|uniref:RagB/SusD family nutrient uptake outer membrane protein n=1 Tax=Pedobacter panaciterrae TaxID=363849 RepID=UPI002597F585|nr:RagB/SusD family nutrient uptake outer membrane protein [uncultured Pedobacter sp.]
MKKKFIQTYLPTPARSIFLGLAIGLLAIVLGCKKQNEWLEEKTNKSAVVPKTIEDLQALLDNSNQVMNTKFSTSGLVGSDNIYANPTALASLSEIQRNLYLWNKGIFTDGYGYEWATLYAVIANANVVIEGLANLSSGTTEYNNVKGAAYFFRAYALYTLAQVYCKPYSSTAESDPGLPLRLASDVNIIYQRSSLADTYKQIISDAAEAAKNLKLTQQYIMRPNRAAAYALLAKASLNKADFNSALSYANLTLKDHNELLDYNSSAINMNSANRFKAYGTGNPEILFYAESQMYSAVLAYVANPVEVASELYVQYQSNDLRKEVFYTYNNGPRYVGSYTGRDRTFCGIAANEVYLIKAECEARNGDYASAQETINKLLVKRYKTGAYIPVVFDSKDEALLFTLTERRKELPLVANIRWEDLRRLNLEPAFQKTITRDVDGVAYTLLPNDRRYVLPIPNEEIILSGIEQNER